MNKYIIELFVPDGYGDLNKEPFAFTHFLDKENLIKTIKVLFILGSKEVTLGNVIIRKGLSGFDDRYLYTLDEWFESKCTDKFYF